MLCEEQSWYYAALIFNLGGEIIAAWLLITKKGLPKIKFITNNLQYFKQIRISIHFILNCFKENEVISLIICKKLTKLSFDVITSVLEISCYGF